MPSLRTAENVSKLIYQSEIEKPGWRMPPVMVIRWPSSFGQPGGCFPTILVLTSLRVEIPRRVALQQSSLLSLRLLRFCST